MIDILIDVIREKGESSGQGWTLVLPEPLRASKWVQLEMIDEALNDV